MLCNDRSVFFGPVRKKDECGLQDQNGYGSGTVTFDMNGTRKKMGRRCLAPGQSGMKQPGLAKRTVCFGLGGGCLGARLLRSPASVE